MIPSFSFEQVMAWQKAHQFTVLVYQMTRSFPKDELFGLTSQFRRAAVSIEANIAEGYREIGKADKLRFLNIAQGSLKECRDYRILAKDLNYISDEEYEQLRLSILMTSKFLNAYCDGIINNNAMKNDTI